MTWEVLCDVQTNTATIILGSIKFVNGNLHPGSNSQGNALTVRRNGSVTLAAASHTPNATLWVGRGLLLSLTISSLTAVAILRGLHNLSLGLTVDSNTPEDGLLRVQRKLNATSFVVSQVPPLPLVITGNAWAIGSVRMRFRVRSS